MATPQPLTTNAITETDLRTSSARLVWVLNRDTMRSYKAEFRGLQIEIPKDRQKIAKHVRDGGNLMEYLEACKFVRDLKQPQEWVPDGAGKFEPRFYTKELYEQELTAEEFEQIVGQKTKDFFKKEAAAEERKARKASQKAIESHTKKVQASEDE